MANLSFPLRLDGSFLSRCDKSESVVQLLRLMAQTPHGSWKGSKNFGLRNLMQESARRGSATRQATEAINNALKDLGIDDWKVVSIERDSSLAEETAQYSVSVQRVGDDGAPMELRL